MVNHWVSLDFYPIMKGVSGQDYQSVRKKGEGHKPSNNVKNSSSKDVEGRRPIPRSSVRNEVSLSGVRVREPM